MLDTATDAFASQDISPISSSLETNGSSVTNLPEQISNDVLRPSNESNTCLKTRIEGKEGKSSFLQSLFNLCTTLLGLGMLAKPFAFAKAGWLLGSFLLVLYGSFACYTARIVGHIALSDPALITYPDIARHAFHHPRYVSLTRAIVCILLYSYCVVFIILYATSIQTLLPIFTVTQYKLLGLLIFLPSVFLPLRRLAYISYIAVLSVCLVVFVVLFDGASNPHAPGSLREPLQTDLFPAASNSGRLGFQGIGMTAGLFMAGLSGHALIPEIARDMRNPKHFDLMITLTFVIVTGISAIIGGAGYLMFGRDVSGEVSLDVLQTTWPNRSSNILNKIMTWSLVVTPLTKFGVAFRPINAILETFVFPSPSIALPPGDEDPSRTLASPFNLKALSRRATFSTCRIFLACFAVFLSIMLPSFASMVALLGSFGTLLTIHGPICAKIALINKGTVRLVDGFILVVVTVLSLWGTVESFMSQRAVEHS